MAFDWEALAKGASGLIGSILGFGASLKQDQTNRDIANQNLMYQYQRDIINDARYADETAYNRSFVEDERNYQRAFAEDERTYNRALQQEIFNREDTALERQASQLSALGINPLSQQMNGLNSGNIVSSSTPGSSQYPIASNQSSQPLHNDYKSELGTNINHAISTALSLADTFNGIKTGEYQRDSLALANDEQYLKNLLFAKQLGIDYAGPKTNKGRNYSRGYRMTKVNGDELYDFNPYLDMAGEASFDKNYSFHRDFMHDIDTGLYGNDDNNTRFIKNLSNLDFSQIAENILTQSFKLSQKMDSFKNDSRIKDNPIFKFFSLFY